MDSSETGLTLNSCDGVTYPGSGFGKLTTSLHKDLHESVNYNSYLIEPSICLTTLAISLVCFQCNSFLLVVSLVYPTTTYFYSHTEFDSLMVINHIFDNFCSHWMFRTS